MTKKEITGNRNHGLWFSGWIRNNLPDSYCGYRAYDIDFVLWNKQTKDIMLIELKSYNSYPTPDQKLIFKLLNKWIIKGIDKEWTYHKLHLIQFENTNFDNGRCFLDKEEISEKDLITFLSFKKMFNG